MNVCLLVAKFYALNNTKHIRSEECHVTNSVDSLHMEAARVRVLVLPNKKVLSLCYDSTVFIQLHQNLYKCPEPSCDCS
jgi:hypothetical protein